MMRRSTLFVVAAAVGLLGCKSMGIGQQQAESVPLQASARIPAAEGTVALRPSKEAQGNNSLEITVKHMAEAEKVAPGSNTYVVWLRPNTPDAKPMNIGALSPGSDKSATLVTTTPYKQFEVFITPEQSAAALNPSGEQLLSARIQK